METPQHNPESFSSRPIMSAPSEPLAPQPPSAPKRRLKPWMLGLGVLVILTVAGAVASSLVYLRTPTDPFVRVMTSVFPYPAFAVNGDRTSIKEYLMEYDALKTYFETLGSASAPAEEDLERNIVDTMINREVLTQMAAEYGLEVDESQVDAILNDVSAAPGGEEAFQAQLAESFGWDLEEFKARVVHSIVLANQLTEHIGNNQDLQKERNARAEEALAKLRAGDSFHAIAGEYSEDFSAKAGGDIGFLPMSQIVEPWLSAIESLEVDEISDVVETTEAFLIFQVTDRIEKGEDEEVKLSVIVVNKRGLDEVVDEFIEKSEIERYIGKI